MSTATRPVATLAEHIDVADVFAVGVWAHHFGVSQQRIKDAVHVVGNEPSAVDIYLASLQPVTNLTTERHEKSGLDSTTQRI